MQQRSVIYHLAGMRRKMLWWVLLVCLWSSSAPVLARHGGGRVEVDGRGTRGGEVPGADGMQLVDKSASSAPGDAAEVGVFDTALRGEVAARSGDQPSAVSVEGPHVSSESVADESGKSKLKYDCFRDEMGIYQLDIIGGGRTGGGQRWSNQGDMDRGHRTYRVYRHTRAVGHRSKKVEWMMTNDRQPHRNRRGATARENLLWPNNTIPYTIDQDFSNQTKDHIMKSMRHWMEHTCLQFIPRINHTDYVRFLLGHGCCSSVGRVGGPQIVSVGPHCSYGTMVHEIGHVIGFWHEQSRPDRDDHVTVVEENVWKPELDNFNKYDEKTVNSLGQPYDYDSIMHYGRRSFSLSKKETIIPKEDHEIGQRLGLSVGDILQTRLLYRCHNKQECGGTLFDGNGFISSPSYPQAVAPNVTCDWSIAAPEGSALKLKFIDIDLPAPTADGKCVDSYIEVREGLGELSRMIGQFCGDVKPDAIRREGGQLWVRFKSGRKRHSVTSGFAARYQTVSFKRYLTSPRGIIKSMNYPSSFPPDTDSMWQITVNYGFVILLRLNELLIPHVKKTGCHGDYLKLIDGPDSQSKLISKLCRSQKRVGVVSSGTSLRIELHTVEKDKSAYKSITRFLAKYISRDMNECRKNNGGCSQICFNKIGDYVCGCRPGYNMANDSHTCIDIDECARGNGGCSHRCVNTDGSYRCECPTGLQIWEYNDTHCEDINECNLPHLDLCEHYCHNTYGSFACSCDPAFILGVDGISCELVAGCGGFIHNVEGVISRPDIPINNTHSIDCIWFVDVPDTLMISLRIELFDWPSNNSCTDYILVSGEGSNSGQYPRVCGENNSNHTYDTTSSRIWVHYHSDWPHDGAFLMEYFTTGVSDDDVILCGGSLNESGIIETPGFPSSYPSKLECTWTVRNASLVVFHYEKFDVEPESECQFDYLDLYDGQEGSVNSTHIGRFCGSDRPPNELKLVTGELWMVFRSDATVQGLGFRAEYEVH